MCICLGILLYLSNYIMGRIKNTNIAEGWLVCVSVFYNDLYLSLRMMTNMPVLQNDFVIVGKRMY